VLLLDKPVRISSNHALQAVKRLYRAEKAGHAGTLDPLASGLLPVLLGDATRFSGYLLDAPKCYEAEIRLGVTTATADAEGEVIERKAVSAGRDQIAAVIARFVGTQTQVPPMYSALKRDGTPLYVLARRGETVEREPRTIQIQSIDLLSIAGDRLGIRVACSKGTYIRTLAEDIGAALGCGAHLSALRRTATGAFDLAQATTLDALAAMDEEARDALLRPADAILGQLPRIELDEAAEARFCHGQPIPAARIPPGVCRVYGVGGRFLGLAEERDPGWLAAKRLLGERKPEGSPTG
jgi:tRNA pseudouridine55 synthase